VVVELATSIELLKKKKQEDYPECIIEPLLIQFIRLLHYLKLASKSLELFLTPTIHFVSMWFAKLTPTSNRELNLSPLMVQTARR
jgi:hypothetical protein